VQGGRAAHVEEGVLLAGKGQAGQVLGGGGGTHRHGQVLAQRTIALGKQVAKLGGKGPGGEGGADRRRSPFEGMWVGGIQPGLRGRDARFEAIGLDKGAIRRRGEQKGRRDVKARPRQTDEVGALSARICQRGCGIVQSKKQRAILHDRSKGCRKRAAGGLGESRRAASTPARKPNRCPSQEMPR